MFKLIVPLGLLKENSTCYKITGNKLYTVKKAIHIDSQIITCDKETAFLVSSNGFIKSFPNSMEVKYTCDSIEEIELLYAERKVF